MDSNTAIKIVMIVKEILVNTILDSEQCFRGFSVVLCSRDSYWGVEGCFHSSDGILMCLSKS